MKTTKGLVVGDKVEIVKHISWGPPDSPFVSDYPGFEVGTIHSVCDTADASGSSVMIGIGMSCLVVEAEEVELCRV